MKLRIAHIDDNRRMAGNFVVQRRCWGLWREMYFNSHTQVLKKDMELAEGHLTKAIFEDFHEAMKYARLFKNQRKLIIREVWPV